jgi:hypothetical protein
VLICPLFAESSINLGEIGLQDSISSILEGTASSDGTFSLSLTPDLTIGNLAFQLDLKIKGTAEFDPFDVDFDFSDWELPERGDDQDLLSYMETLAEQYSSFLRYAQWGQRYDKLYLRYGKLSGITLGDGAIVNGFYDTSVSVNTARPGLDIMVDGSLLDLDFTGFEFLMTDIFDPTLLAWRIYTRPLDTKRNENWLSEIEIGVSYASNPTADYDDYSDDPDDTAILGRTIVALDAGVPFYSTETLKLSFFTDLLLQSPDEIVYQPGIATRYGIWGHWKSLYIFNTSITVPHFGTYYADYFDSDFEDKTNEELEDSIVDVGTTRLDTQVAINLASKGAYLSARVRSDYLEGTFSNYSFLGIAKIDKTLFNIDSLDLQYEKLYPTDTGEGFFEGLGTLKNVEIGVTTVINFTPYSFDVSLSMVFDEEADLTMQVETTVGISFF